MIEWKITKPKGQTIRDFLKKEQAFSRRMLKTVIYNGGKISLNGHDVKLNQRLSINDRLTIQFPEEEKGPYMQPEDIHLQIVYEDEFILVIDKPAEIATIPSYHHPTGTLANGVLGYYDKRSIPYTIHIVTRLDKGTSGLVLIAKHRYSHSLLSFLQQGGKIDRTYQAIITGFLPTKEGFISKKIGRVDDSIVKRMVRADGQEAVTHYKTIKHSASYTLVDVSLETGRTHQIRVHFSALGYPLLGDNLYGGENDFINRQALHCYRLRFDHPFTKEKMVFNSELPLDMKRLL